jgi:hypothetical protein
MAERDKSIFTMKEIRKKGFEMLCSVLEDVVDRQLIFHPITECFIDFSSHMMIIGSILCGRVDFVGFF